MQPSDSMSGEFGKIEKRESPMNKWKVQRLVCWCLLGLIGFGMPSVSQAQLGNSLLGDRSLTADGGAEGSGLKPKLEMRLVPETAAVGEKVTAEITIRVGKEAYVYSQNPNIGAETKIDIQQVVGLEPLEQRFTPDRKPKVEIEPLFDNAKLEKFYGGVTWRKQFRVTEPTARLTGKLVFQVCDETTCNPFNEPIELALGKQSAETSAPKKTPSLRMVLEGTDADDPAEASTKSAEDGNILAEILVVPRREFGSTREPVEFRVRLLEATEERTGERDVLLAITAHVEGKWHIYALDQDPKMFALPTVLKIEATPGLKPLDEFQPDQQAEEYRPEEDVLQLVHNDTVTWQQRFRFNPDQFEGSLRGSVRYQLCDDKNCLPPHTAKFELALQDSADQRAADVSAPLIGETDATERTDRKTSASPATGPIEEQGAPHERGLIAFLITGVIFGYLALLTPCVFPMIPITISFFLKQAEREHHNPVGLALLYCLGIIATFTLIGVFASALFGTAAMTEFANNFVFNLFLAGVLIFFGFNMLGLFEIRVPSWLLSWSSARESTGGVIGVLFMAFTFTLVSFTCTFAFVGFLLPMASRGEFYWPILGMLAFSTAFASPFFFLALFPSYLKKLPKSGGWMNNVKVTCGLVELAAAFKFLSVADIALFSEPFLFDYSLVMTSWLIIGIVTGLYLLGVFRLPHDTPSDHIGVIRLAFAMTFLGFSTYIAAGIFAPQKPEGLLWQQIVSFAPPSYSAREDVDLGPTLSHDNLDYALDVEQAIAFAQARNQPMFFDFTGTNCINCRFMEFNVFPRSDNRELLSEFVRVQLYTDVIPAMHDSARSEELLRRNRSLQAEWFNDATLPAYAIVTPDGQTILGSYKGNERVQGQFTRFLQTGLEEWQRVKTTEKFSATTRR